MSDQPRAGDGRTWEPRINPGRKSKAVLRGTPRCPTPPPVARRVTPIRVDITMWLDDSEHTDIHVHEDAFGEGPIIGFSDLTHVQRMEISDRLFQWARSLRQGIWS